MESQRANSEKYVISQDKVTVSLGKKSPKSNSDREGNGIGKLHEPDLNFLCHS